MFDWFHPDDFVDVDSTSALEWSKLQIKMRQQNL